MAQTNTVRDRDLGWKAHGRRMAELRRGGIVVRIGINAKDGGAPHQDGDRTVIENASVHEFGTINQNPNAGLVIPERSFIRATFDKHLQENIDLARTLGRAVILATTNLRAATAIMGLRLRSQVLNAIDAGIPPELKPATIARKGSSTPLIETEQMKQAISFEVDL